MFQVCSKSVESTLWKEDEVTSRSPHAKWHQQDLKPTQQARTQSASIRVVVHRHFYTAFLAKSTNRFSGAIVVEVLPCPRGRQFFFRATMRPHLGIYKQLTSSGQKPPTHFHLSQWEFFKVLKGSLTIDFNGVARECTPEDGEVDIKPGTHHVMYGTPGKELDEVEFEISGDGGEGELAMDLGFFENWYGYQEDVFQRGQKLDVIRVLSVCMGL